MKESTFGLILTFVGIAIYYFSMVKIINNDKLFIFAIPLATTIIVSGILLFILKYQTQKN